MTEYILKPNTSVRKKDGTLFKNKKEIAPVVNSYISSDGEKIVVVDVSFDGRKIQSVFEISQLVIV